MSGYCLIAAAVRIMAWDERDDRLLAAHEQRLSYLEERKALLGNSADVSLDIDIEQARSNVDTMQALKKVAVPPSRDVQAAVKRTLGDFDLASLFIQGVQINARVTDLEKVNTEQTKAIEVIQKQTAQVVTQQHAAQRWRLDVDHLIRMIPRLVQDHGTERKQRLFGQWLNRAIMFGMAMFFDLSVRHQAITLETVGAALIEVTLATLAIVLVVRAALWARTNVRL